MIKNMVKNRILLFSLIALVVCILLLALFFGGNSINAVASDIVLTAEIGNDPNVPPDLTIVWMVIGILGGTVVIALIAFFAQKIIREKREDAQAEKDYIDEKIERQARGEKKQEMEFAKLNETPISNEVNEVNEGNKPNEE